MKDNNLFITLFIFGFILSLILGNSWLNISWNEVYNQTSVNVINGTLVYPS